MPDRLKSYSAPNAPQPTGYLEIAGQSVPVTIRFNANARRFVLRIDPSAGGVRVTVPSRRNAAQALEFARSQSGWIAARLASLPQSVPFLPGETVPYLGTPHLLQHEPGRSARGSVWRKPAGEHPPEESAIFVSGDPAFAPRRLHDWFKAEARRHLTESVFRHADALNVRPSRIAIRDQTSRWGSCSSTRVLSFSWRLVLAPHQVLDYVAAHEVAHLAEMNHSLRFWRLVETVLPDYKQSKFWLERHGANLHRYGILESPPQSGGMRNEDKP